MRAVYRNPKELATKLKDVVDLYQDDLLSYMENGLLIVAGCTTSNPFHSINPAIRSRCHILEVKSLTVNEIIVGLKRAASSLNGLNNQYIVHYTQSISDQFPGKIEKPRLHKKSLVYHIFLRIVWVNSNLF